MEENSNTDSQLFFWFQNHNHNFPPSSHSTFHRSSSMSNTETNTVDEEDVCESYMTRDITKKRKLTPIQQRLLEESFDQDKRLEPERKLWLAEKLGLQPSQVAVWFQNRRARFKTKQLEYDCDSLKDSYAKLKNDRDILFLQNQTLKNKVILSFLKEKLRIRENLETQFMEERKLGEEVRSTKSDVFDLENVSEEEESMRNQYSFPELAVLGFYYDPTLTASNLRL
ncbi:unnamed protein product [Cochlearia groenlandica]